MADEYKKPDADTVWKDLEEYKEFCRLEMRKFDPSDLYRKESADYRAFLASKKPKTNMHEKSVKYIKRKNNG